MATEDDASSTQFNSSKSDILEGASLSERFQVEGSKCSLSVTPVLVDFRRLLQQEKLGRGSKELLSVIPGISNGELLHAVIGLYDTSLSEMTPDVLYSTVCDKWARTIILIRDVKDVFLEFEKRRDKPQKPHTKIEEVNIGEMQSAEDKYSAPDAIPCTFSACYSDSESDEEADSDDEEEDFSQGINTYLKSVSHRRHIRSKHTGPFTLQHIGPENRIVAACTFDKKYIKSGEKIIHLTLVTIRKRFRRLGLGKYLIQKVKDAAVVGPHDAVVVHAENEATSFFARYGFSDDVILNNRWREIAEQFTNCTLLSYIPAYSGQAISGKVTDFDLLTLDQDLRKWKDRSIEAYQAQVTIIERMKAEMIRLRAMVTSQEDIIHDLKSKVHSLETHKLRTDRELMLHKIKSMSFCTTDGEDMTDGLTEEALESRYQVLSAQLPEAGDTDTNHLIDTTAASAQLSIGRPPPSPIHLVSSEQELRRYMVVPKQSGEVYDHGKDIAEFHRICEDFKSSLKKDPKIHNDYTVTSVSKAILNQTAVERYADTLSKLGDTSMIMKLYFCGTLDHPEKLKNVLKNGFSDQDFTDGDYGRGLYFSRYASTAVHFSTPNKVLVAEVIVGKCQTLISKEKGRRSPDSGYNSILCPGRLLATCGDGSVIQEYVIYSSNQALPLDLIEFTVATAANAGQPTEVIAADTSSLNNGS